ncbi:Ribulose-bisphosphate carboxylase [Chloroherpeton thalassium ATCC 35110]|uniref:Ribulose-bisphosphate carboxylase n=1 Tax=Chloroherpeton thalassium (strain ATCC 35110 / GB-78) TaxID=517418 RepID=B3QT65_CHLT3|nr:RuBisCO large subunit C-terminal-like domain-containing protein [Chloroherpeton thalassium]ACF14164.1 Ribulose-bisphosphate carboxylase [Chloroherpeton thalassium ATCC 35110]
MEAKDIPGFFAKPEEIDAEKYIYLDYYFECIGEPEAAAAHLCSEQSTAQWKRVGIDEDFREEFGAKVLELKVIKELDEISCPVKNVFDGKTYACKAKIAHPHNNFGPRIPNLLSAVCGEGTFFSPGIPIIKLLDIHFPKSYLNQFEGPKFGIEGLREILNVYDRPIFFGVIKPNIGLPPEPFSEIGYQSWLGGLDIAKDDEMLADTSWSPTPIRSKLLGAAREKAERETGVPKIYLANITDEVDRIIELHDIAVENGANALMLNAMPVGLSAVRMLRKHTKVPLIAHFPFTASFSRMQHYGIHSQVITKLQRLAGFDSIIMPGFGNRMMTPEDEVLQNIKACYEDMGHIKRVLPVPGGSDSAVTLKNVYEKVGSTDFGFVPGRGVFGHPMGPKAGAASIRQAWEAISSATPIETYAETHEELKAAIHAFSKRK